MDVGSGRQIRCHWAGSEISKVYALPNCIPTEVLIASLLHSLDHSILVLLGQRLAGGQHKKNLLEQISLAGVVPFGRHFEGFGVSAVNECFVSLGLAVACFVSFLPFVMQIVKKRETRAGGERQLVSLVVLRWEGGRMRKCGSRETRLNKTD